MTALSRQCVVVIDSLGTGGAAAATRQATGPLGDVAGRPFWAHVLINAARYGFEDFLLLTARDHEGLGELADQVAGTLDARVRIIRASASADSAATLVQAADLLADEFLMLRGDSLFDFNFLDLATKASRPGWIGRVALKRARGAGPAGGAEVITGEQAAEGLQRTPSGDRDVVNGGVYWLRKAIMQHITAGSCSMERDVLPRLAREGLLLAWAWDGPLIDVGTRAALSRVRSRWADTRRRPAVFFDRDGVLNHDDGYVCRVDDFRWTDGAREAIKECNDANLFVFVVTNQSGVARGHYDERAVRKLHAWMNETLRQYGAHIDAFRYCPHHPDGVVAEYARLCIHRKPGPGMIESIISQWPIDRERSLLVGDAPTDMQAAAAAGIVGARFPGGNLRDFVRQRLPARK